MAFQDYKIDKAIPTILHDQIRQIILNEIENGNVGINEAIPTEEELCTMYGVSRTTVRRAISGLVKDERLYRVKSKGTFVKAPKPTNTSELIVCYDTSIGHIKDAVLSQALTLGSVELVMAPEYVADYFHIKVGSPVISVRRYQQSDGNIICTLDCYLSYPTCNFVFQEVNELAKGSIHPYLAQHSGCLIDDYTLTMTAYTAASDECKLNVKNGDIICKVLSCGCSKETKQPIYYEIIKYVADKMDFILHYRY